MNLKTYKTILGSITLVENNGSITNLFFECDTLPKVEIEKESPLLKEAYNQLQRYFSGTLQKFTVPLAPSGTPFRQKTWKRLLEIPYGETATYKDIAVDIGNPYAYRAVGMANNKNPIPIFIPCHRVIGTNGAMVGYRGGIVIKEKLLALEKNAFRAPLEHARRIR